MRTHDHRELQFEIDRGLSDLPWELLTGKHGAPLAVECSPARTVATDAVTTPPRIDGSLQAMVFAADDLADGAAGWEAERDRIATGLRIAGVSEVRCPAPTIGKERLLEEIVDADIVHLIGHAEITESSEEHSHFVLGPETSLTSEDLRHRLGQGEPAPTLVFLNACGSAEERRDTGGKALAGLATPFLEKGCLIVATFWPVQSLFASDLAISFYKRALPAPSSLVFRWLRHQPLNGLSFSQALCEARQDLFAHAPHTDPTWSAYTLFGNSTARINLG